MKLHLFTGFFLLSTSLLQANRAVEAAPRHDWINRHNQIVAKVKSTPNTQLMIAGDSITQAWEGPGSAVWKERYEPLKAVNLGISGDRTENLLWRLRNGGMDGIQPKVAMVLIGTNNLKRGDTPEQIAEGVDAVVKEILKRSSSTKVLLLAIFPREEHKDAPLRLKVASLNRLLPKLDDGKQVFFLDIGEKFLEPDGSLSREVMPDFLHLSQKGYQIWADNVAEKLSELLK
jgi:lysophospholipase L1-like esterase